MLSMRKCPTPIQTSVLLTIEICRPKDIANKADLADALASHWASEFLYVGYHRPPSAVIGD